MIEVLPDFFLESRWMSGSRRRDRFRTNGWNRLLTRLIDSENGLALRSEQMRGANNRAGI